MTYKFLITAFIFSFFSSPQQLIAMEEEWWGADVEGPSSISISLNKHILHVTILDTTGFTGTVAAPTINIKLPENAVKDFIDGQFVKYKTNALIINGEGIHQYTSFEPLTADSHKLRLRHNGKDIPE